MRMTWIHLRRDFGLNGGNYEKMAYAVEVGDISGYRGIDHPGYNRSDTELFRRCYQLQSLFKRYRFTKDMYNESELAEQTISKLLDCQVRIGLHERLDSEKLFRVLQLARRINKDILGSYDPNVHASLCRFAKRATYGNPRNESFLDSKLGVLTGSPDHIKWFKSHLQSDDMLDRCVKQCSPSQDVPVYVECDCLRLTNVPKSFKALRSIMPNTTLGSFYSAGLGDFITDRLAKSGINIRRLQEKHQDLARAFSISRSHVTADLSSASDTITFALLSRIIPRDWMRALNFGRIRQFLINDRRYYLHSFMTMGIGFTFPLETLVFYSLLESLRRLTKTPGFVSVYGDDLIYHRSMHPYVLSLFKELRFVLNEDKTFVESNFRESCGGDYYHGTDVRPFQPENAGASSLSQTKYISYLYKIVNGLLMRWKESEIPQTYKMLVENVLYIQGYVDYVPSHFPPTAGIHVTSVPGARIGARIVWNPELMMWVFPYLKEKGKFHKINYMLPYLWECLRSKSSDREPSIYDEAIHTITWKKSKPSRYIRDFNGKRLRRKIAYVRDKERPRYIRETGQTSFWT